MVAKNIVLGGFNSDLRSAKGTTIKKGLLIKILRVFALILLDVISLTSAWFLAIKYGTLLISPWVQNLSFTFLNCFVQVAILSTTGLYKSGCHRRNYWSIFKAVSLSVILLSFIAFLYEPNHYISRSSFLIYWSLSIFFICTLRLLFDLSTKLLRRKGLIRHPIFLITAPEEKDYYLNLIKQEDCYNIQGIAESSCLDLANRDKTFEYLRKNDITEAFVSWSSIKNRLYVCWHFSTAGITIKMLPSEYELHHYKSTFSLVGNIQCPTITSPVIVGGDFWMKRIIDITFSVILISLLSPLYLLIAILIKLDSPGPVFFRQKRIGLNSKEFKIWKFRTMVTNAEQLQKELEAKNEIKDGVLFKMKDDPRVTKIGKFLRAYSLDELPQIFNVLAGEMSLVGPRPLPIRDVEKFTTHHFIRQDVLPGITGLWQVSGRSDIDNFEDAVKLDLRYIENWSIWLDFSILLQTVKVVLRKTGAY
ncbi:MAG: sugar transferase [Calothrix sp. C42_A2020_038]|nr:sugar transferase [Calothrix sp. C42_A2020_038]